MLFTVVLFGGRYRQKNLPSAGSWGAIPGFVSWYHNDCVFLANSPTWLFALKFPHMKWRKTPILILRQYSFSKIAKYHASCKTKTLLLRGNPLAGTV